MGIHGNLLFPLHEHLSDDVNLLWKGLFVNLKIKSRGKCLAETLKVRITSLCWMSSHASAGEWLQSAQRASITGSVMDGGAAGHLRAHFRTHRHIFKLCVPRRLLMSTLQQLLQLIWAAERLDRRLRRLRAPSHAPSHYGEQTTNYSRSQTRKIIFIR